MQTINETEILRVLLIEDNPDDANYIQEALSVQDMFQKVELIWVKRLLEGLKTLNSMKIDVILLDLTLPDGLLTDSVSKILEHTPDVPIIVLTGFDDKDTALTALKNGAQDYLIKGKVSTDLLIRSIRYSIERRRSEHLARLRAAQEIEDLIFTLTNDLRVPHIGAIRAFDLLIKEILGPLNEEQKTILKKAKQNSQEILHMLQNLVHLYRQQLRSDNILAVPTDVKRLVWQVVDDWAYMAGENNVQIETRTDFAEPILVDGPAFKKAVSNLVHNAIKFSPPEGRVSIDCKRDETGVNLLVSDNGRGLTESELKNLFERFWSENDNRRHSNGNGVGLYVSRQIIEAHGGTISCASSEGKGTTFCIRLPYAIN